MVKIHFLFIFFTLGFNQIYAQGIASFTPTEITGGIGEILTIKGNGFGVTQADNYVSFFTEGGQYTSADESKKFRYISWNDSEIRLEMPVAYSNKVKVLIAGSTFESANSLRVMANLGYRSANPLVYDYLIDRNEQGGITWFIHPTFWNNIEIREAIADVVREFRCKTGVNYTIEPLKDGIPFNLDQGIHIIAPDKELAPVGYNSKLWSSCILGSETFYYNKTQLLHFNTEMKWYYGKGKTPSGTTKFRYVLFHEMGHSLGLSHVNEEGQSMYPSVNLLPSDNWSERDSITVSEKNAIRHYVEESQNFTFRACGVEPLSVLKDCKNVYSQNVGISSNFHQEIFVYPNPATQDIFLEGLPTAVKSIRILNILGETMLRSNVMSQVSVRDLPSGTYILLFSNEQGATMGNQRFIKR